MSKENISPLEEETSPKNDMLQPITTKTERTEETEDEQQKSEEIQKDVNQIDEILLTEEETDIDNNKPDEQVIQQDEETQEVQQDEQEEEDHEEEQESQENILQETHQQEAPTEIPKYVQQEGDQILKQEEDQMLKQEDQNLKQEDQNLKQEQIELPKPIMWWKKQEEEDKPKLPCEVLTPNDSRDPSYTNLTLPYSVICRQRYQKCSRKYRKQFIAEIKRQENLQFRALDGIRIRREFCDPLIEPLHPEDKIKLTPKQQYRLDEILRTKF